MVVVVAIGSAANAASLKRIPCFVREGSGGGPEMPGMPAAPARTWAAVTPRETSERTKPLERRLGSSWSA